MTVTARGSTFCVGCTRRDLPGWKSRVGKRHVYYVTRNVKLGAVGDNLIQTTLRASIVSAQLQPP